MKTVTTSTRQFIFESYRLEAKMKKENKFLNAVLAILFVTLFMILFEMSASAQSMGVNNPNPHTKSLLDLTSTSKGLLTPRMTEAQRIAMFPAFDASAKGMLVYQTDNTQGFYYYGGATWQLVNSTAGWSVTGNSGTTASTNFIGTTDNNDMVFKTNNSERMRVDVNGNIGIDTVAPKARMHIKSNSSSLWPQILVEERDSADYSRISFMNKGTNKFWTVAATSAVADSNSRFNIFNSSTFDLLTVTGTGKVGLGYTNPRQRLEVNGNITLTNSTNNIRVNDIRVFSVAGISNLFAGKNTGINNTSGEGNTFTGSDAGVSSTTGNWNSFFGSGAGYSNTTGYYNCYFGISAGYYNTTGFNNTALGNDASKNTTTGSYNTTTGSWSGYSNTTGHHNSFFGVSSGYLNTTGGYNTALGNDAMRNNTTGDYNTFTGGAAGYSNTTGHRNIFNGAGAGFLNTTGAYNTAIGTDAMHDNTSGDYNTFTGAGTGYKNTTGHRNVLNGVGAGYLNTTGAYNTALGTDAMHENTTGSYNTITGCFAGYSSTTGQRNVFSGVASGNLNTTGSWNTALGTDALHDNQIGNNNVTVGFEAGFSTTVSNNVMMGFRAGKFNTLGTNNTFIGINAGNANTTGSNNLAIGNNAQVATALTNASAIGNNSSVTTSNSLVLGGTGADAVNVGIGLTNPEFPLSFSGALGDKISFWGGAGNHYGIGMQSYLLQIHSAASSDDIAFGYGSSASFTENMRIKGNGNVGIGTSTINYRLQVSSNNGTFPLGIQSTLATGYSGMHILNNAGSIVGHLGVGNASSPTFANTFYVGSTTALPVLITSNNTTRIQILATGEVGINTSTPTTDLEVNGFTKLGSNAPAVKIIKFAGNTSTGSPGFINFAHGLNLAKILSVTVMVQSTSGDFYPPNSSTSSGAHFSFSVNPSQVYIYNLSGNSSNITNRPYRVLITYEE